MKLSDLKFSLTVAMVLTACGGETENVRDGAPAGCTECEIELTHVVTLGSLDGIGTETISEHSSIAIDSERRILVATRGFGTSHFAVFDSTGSFLRTVGRAGEGPGEYSMVWHLNSTPDFISIFDFVLKRRTLLDYSFEYLRSDHVNIRQGLTTSGFLPNGDQVFGAEGGPEGHSDDVVHVITSKGEWRSFGRRADGHAPAQSVTVGEDRVWTVAFDRYLITEWNLVSGEVIRQLAEDAEWFDSEDTGAYPSSMVKRLRFHARQLWVMGDAPDPRWTDRMFESGPLPDVPPSEMRDGILDVIDLETGKVIAHGRWDATFIDFIPGSDLVARYREDEMGVPFIDLLRVRLK